MEINGKWSLEFYFESSTKVHEALQEVLTSHHCTCLVITHRHPGFEKLFDAIRMVSRMSSLQWCDRVAVAGPSASLEVSAPGA